MLKKLQKRTEGFTIIEVMIVLAIAALILLIVLLAVPALQRNSRNTTLKNDAATISAGFSEYLSNNDGAIPASISGTAPNITIGAAGSSQSAVKVSSGTTVNLTKATPTAFASGQLWWNTGTTCGGTANPRAITVYYYAEVAGTPSNTPKCVDAS
jgi:prepilin-type N-terminal cleavage/methylation domain-containing protein